MTHIQINPDGYSVQELSELTGFEESTIRQWSLDFDIPSSKDGRKNLFMADAQITYNRIIELKDAGYTKKQIIAELGMVKPERHDSHESEWDIQSLVTQAVEQAIEKHQGLAEKFARATYDIGRLETQVKYLDEAVKDRDEKLKLLPEALSQSEREKQEMEYQIKELQSSLSAMTTQLAEVNRHVDAMTVEGQNAQNELAAIRQNVTTLMTDNKSLQSELSECHEEIAQLRSERDELKQVVSNKEFEMASLSDKWKFEKEELEQALDAERRKGFVAKLFGK